ncbi:MAG: amino acid adenylation domain-containing protein, partial [Myxococcota bacterium]|nr:amino acid adenylation domain-containing protein [Myxococcota bacterium]
MFVSDGRLRVNSPKGQLSDALKKDIAAHRDELVQLVGGQPLDKVESLPRGGSLPLSFFQERLWLLHQFQPQSTAYNMTAVWSSDGTIGLSYLEQALSAILQRHEILRSVFRDQDGVPQLLVLPEGEPVQIKDLRAIEGEEEQRAAIEEDGDEQVHTPFDLKHRPPARFVIYRLPEERLVTRLVAHHIAVDAWSMALLGREVRAAYDGRESEPPTRLQYVDFASWQRSALEPTKLESELSWWARTLAGAPATSTLPSPRSRRAFAPGATRVFKLDLELSNELRAVAREERATVYMGLVSACACVLHSYTGQYDVVLGSPMGSRERPEFENLIGPFVSVLALRLDLSGDPSFAELLSRARGVVLDAHAHRDLPFEKLVEHLKPERSFDRTPLFQVAVVLQNAPTLERIDSGGAIFDLTWFFREVGGELVCGVEYRCDVYDAEMIDEVHLRFEEVLRAALRDRRAPLSQFARFADPPRAVSALRPRAPERPPEQPTIAEQKAPLPLKERERLIQRGRESFRGPIPTTPVIELFEAQVRRTPDAVAVLDASGSLTYAELDRAANALARRLADAGVGVGSRVAIGLERSKAVVVAVLAVLRLRAAYVPLDPRFPADRLAYLFEDAEPTALVTDESRARLPVPPHLPCVTVELAPGSELPAPDAGSVSPDDVAYVMYTSGSTGRPKGVEIQNRALTNFLISMLHTPGLGREDRVLSVTTISFDISGLEMFLPLICGAELYIVSRDVLTDGARLAQLAERFDATLLQATPATFRLLLEADWKGSPKLKILCGGEAMPRELANQLLARAGSVWNMYGPTETTIWSTVQKVQLGDGPVPIGYAIDNTALYILDSEGELVPDGATGEIFIGGAGVARGYLKRPELTAARFLPDPFAGGAARMYRTGDAGRFRPDGALEYLGRLDDQVKIRGHRIELGEIESVIREHPGVAAAVVAAREARPG